MQFIVRIFTEETSQEVSSTVGAISGGAFGQCRFSGGFICRDGCRFRVLDGLVLSHDCEVCYCSYGVLSSVCIPDGVRELCNGCFEGCESLRRVTFGSSSSLERIGFRAFPRSVSCRYLCDPVSVK